MKNEKFLQSRAALLIEQNKLQSEINKRYGAICSDYISANTDFKVRQVVITGDGNRKKRMVIFQIDPVILFEDTVIIKLYGWFLSADNICTKWNGQGLTISGVGNPDKVELSDNQTYIEPAA